MTQWDVLIYIGRFQPLHQGHIALLTQALQLAEEVVVVIGSARSARNVRNPFTAAERRAMILAALPEYAGRLHFVAMRDYYDTARWAGALQRQIGALLPTTAKVGIYGHFKDASSDYLRVLPAWPLIEAANFDGLNASDLRSAWFEASGETQVLNGKVATPVAEFLRRFSLGAEFKRLKAEHDYLTQYRQQWRLAPYAPTFVTVDAVVTCQQHVLLVQRGGQPGRGSWALPGGFLDQREQVAEASVRELMEETRIAVDEAALRQSLRGQGLFDHPDRSLRGRTLTHAFHYALDLPALPSIEADDDAAAARWVAIASLADMEQQMYDDHYMILDHFLDLIDESRVVEF